MKMGKILLLITLLVLLLSTASAKELTDNSTSTCKITEEVVQDTNSVSYDTDTVNTKEAVKDSNIIAKNIEDKTTDNDKTIVKSDKNSTKTSSYTFNVDNTDALYNAIHTKDYDDVTINIISDFTLNNSKKLEQTNVTTFTINGNGHTINGNKKYQFLWIICPCTLSISNLTLLNCRSNVHGGAIDLYGPNGTINDCKFINCSSFFGGALDHDNNGVLFLNNCLFKDNYAFSNDQIEKGGGAISNEHATLIINNCTITNNHAKYPGGAINNVGTLYINNSTLTDNYSQKNGGAINNPGTLYINNSTISKNKAYIGGAIFNKEGNYTITNSLIKDNEDEKEGGAISNDNSWNLTIINCTFNNNTSEFGGAIYNYENGAMTINDSTFNNNSVRNNGDGAAIFNTFHLNINNSTFNSNTADGSGGAIKNRGGKSFDAILTLVNCRMNNNVANDKGEGYGGGAIYNYLGKLLIYDSSLNNNKANKYGGAILCNGISNITGTIFNDNEAIYGGAAYINGSSFNVYDSKFKNNTATNTLSLIPGGGAIFSLTNCNIEDNVFAANQAKYSTGIVMSSSCNPIVASANAILENNVNANRTIYNATITALGEKVQIKNNIFDDGPFATSIMVYSNNTSPIVNEKISLKFILQDDFNTTLAKQIISVTINDDQYTRETNKDGIVNIEYTPTTHGTLKITANYALNDNFKGSSTTLTIPVRINTQVLLDDATTIVGKKCNIKGSLIDTDNNPIIKENIYMTIDNHTYLLTTNEKGEFNTTLTFTKSGKYDMIVSFKGNNISAPSEKTQTTTVLPEARIVIEILNNTQSNVKIEITVTDTTETALPNQDVIITLPNGQTTTKKTGSDGKITITDTTATTGEKTITTKIKTTEELIGTTKSKNITIVPDYQKIIDKLTDTINELLKVSDTTITINPIKASVGSIAKLSAKIRDTDGKNVTEGKVIFKINGKTLKDENQNPVYAIVNNGTASIEYKVHDVWMKNTSYVEAVYSGSQHYTTSRTKSKNALKISAGTVNLTLDKAIITAKSGERITLRAKVLDANGDRINGAKVVFKLNGKSLTDKNGNVLYAKVVDGEAVLDYLIPTKYSAKTYTVTAVYGSSYYERTETNGKLVLEKKAVSITTDSITTVNKKTTIKATIKDEREKLLVTSTKLAVKVNNKTILSGVNSTKGIIDVSFTSTLRPGMYEMEIISGENSIYKKATLTTVLKI